MEMIAFFTKKNQIEKDFKNLKFRAIYLSYCVFNLTMTHWLDIANFIFSKKKQKNLNTGTTFCKIDRTQHTCFVLENKRLGNYMDEKWSCITVYT